MSKCTHLRQNVMKYHFSLLLSRLCFILDQFELKSWKKRGKKTIFYSKKRVTPGAEKTLTLFGADPFFPFFSSFLHVFCAIWTDFSHFWHKNLIFARNSELKTPNFVRKYTTSGDTIFW